MKTSFVILAAASAVALSAPAAAQSAPDATFTGLWGGVIGGYDVSRPGDTDVTDDEKLDGFAYGIQAGYDFDMGGVVVGVEGEYADSTAKREVSTPTSSATFRAGRDLYIGARVGAKVGPDAMIYAKGGYTNAHYDVDFISGNTAFDSKLKADGFRLGAGAEYATSANSFVKLEYRYSNYSEAETSFGGTPTDNFSIDTDRHQVMAGVGFRF